MKLVQFQLRQTPPVQIVEMSDLTEVVVIAGPTEILFKFTEPSDMRAI